MQKLCCVCTRQQFSASLVYLVTSLPPYLHQFSTISVGNCIKEEAMLQADGQLEDPIESWSLKRTISVLNTIPQSETLDFHLGDTMHSHELVNTDTHGPQTIASITSSVRKPCIQATHLAKNWGIELETATCTVEATTQRGLWTVLHNTLSRRFCTNDRQLRY